MIKTNFEPGNTNFKTYEWIETTNPFIKGEENPGKQNQCYYSVDLPAEKVVFDLTHSTLPDGTQYPVNIMPDAPAKELKIVMENSGHKKGAGL